jgi:hypothetical protein
MSDLQAYDPNFRVKPGEPLPEAWVKAAMGEDVLLPGEFIVPHSYVAGVAAYVERELRANNFTRDVTVAMNVKEPQVAITLSRKIGGGYVLKTDCSAAWEQKLEPDHVARTAVKRLIGEIEAGKLSN